MLRFCSVLWLALLILTAPAWAQQELRSGKKGTTNPMPVTGSSVDADHNGLDVFIRGNSAGGSGDGVILDGVSAAIKATVKDYANANPLTVINVDTNGDPTSGSFDGILRDGTGDTTQANVSSGRVHVDGSGVTQPVSGTVTANQGGSNWTANITQFGGTNLSTGTGAGGAGIPRVTISNDSSLAANQSVNVNQIAGSAVSTAAAGVQKVGVVGNANAAFDAANAAAPPANRLATGGLTSGATGGLMVSPTHCDSFANVNIVTATTTLIVTGVSGRHVRICGISLVTAGANNVALISGTGATCGTGTTGMTGGTTAATGYNFAANGGISQGTGIGEINRTNATGDSVCIITSAAVQLSGRLSYAIY